MRKIVPGLLALTFCILATPAAGQVADHLKCYKVKDPVKSRAAYALVPATSPRYRDAQKKLR